MPYQHDATYAEGLRILSTKDPAYTPTLFISLSPGKISHILNTNAVRSVFQQAVRSRGFGAQSVNPM